MTPRRAVFSILLLFGLVGLAGMWLKRDESATTQPAPQQRPGAAEERFAGTAKCGECHQEQLDDYHQSGHARTFWTTRDFPFRDRFDGLTFTDPERAATFRYLLTDAGLDVALPDAIAGDRFPLQFAFGSGEHAVTFMSLIPGRLDTTFGVEHRVTWFTGRDAPGITPGQLALRPRRDVEHFGRTIRGEDLERCFGCHTTTYEIREHRLVDYRANVGCESCHGAGNDHVAAAEAGTLDDDLGFAKRPWNTPQQVELCGRCHRSLDEAATGRVARSNPKIVRFQPVGLVQSQCYRQSAGALVCSTCHNPHQHAAQRPRAEYERSCLRCHSAGTESTSCPVSPAKDCVTCHMPLVEVIPGIAFHDHWIRVRDDADPPTIEEAAR